MGEGAALTTTIAVEGRLEGDAVLLVSVGKEWTQLDPNQTQIAHVAFDT